MAIQAKFSLLHLLLAVLLLREVIAQRSTGRNNRRTSTRNKLGSGECKDEEKSHETCVKVIRELGFGVCSTKIVQLKAKLERSCAQSCHYCGKPMQGCRQSQYGCCWDVYTPRGDLYGNVGCPECKDHLSLCRRFINFCRSTKPENKAFMELHCPVTCGKCRPRRRQKITGQKIKMNDWNRL